MRVYLDSVLIIYLIDQNAVWRPLVHAWLAANPCDLISSELGRMEALVLPVRQNDPLRISAFDTFFQLGVQEVVQFTRAVFDRAVQIRAHTKFKTPDSLHLAAAVEYGCDRFLTNDQQLKQFTGITVEVI